MRISRLKEVSFLFNSFSLLITISVLKTIEGDSLSRENLEAYISILRNFGVLEK